MTCDREDCDRMTCDCPVELTPEGYTKMMEIIVKGRQPLPAKPARRVDA